MLIKVVINGLIWNIFTILIMLNFTLFLENLEVAMDAAGVPVNKEVTASVGANTEVQSAYTERIRMFGRSGLDTHPDFCPNRYPNASKFFYDHNNPN